MSTSTSIWIVYFWLWLTFYFKSAILLRLFRFNWVKIIEWNGWFGSIWCKIHVVVSLSICGFYLHNLNSLHLLLYLFFFFIFMQNKWNCVKKSRMKSFSYYCFWTCRFCLLSHFHIAFCVLKSGSLYECNRKRCKYVDWISPHLLAISRFQLTHRCSVGVRQFGAPVHNKTQRVKTVAFCLCLSPLFF